MVQVEIGSNTFNRLQKLAVPLVDTFDTVITRLLDSHEEGKNGASSHSTSIDSHIFSATALPSLTHTKVLGARLNGIDIPNPNWNKVYLQLVKETGVTAKAPEEVRRLILTNYQIGKKEDEGYHYLAPQGISVQGADANGAAKGMFHIAKQKNWSLEIEFAWRQKETAAFPGQIATIKG